MVKTNTLFTFIQENILMVLGIFLIFLGAKLVDMGTMSIGELLSFYLVLGLLKSHLSSFASALPEIIQGKESFKNIKHFLTTPNQPYNGIKKIFHS